MPTKGSTSRRGYDHTHQRERARWATIIDNGQGWCTETRCLHPTRWIPPGTPWDLAHTPDRTGYLGPAHRACNRSEGATRGNHTRRARHSRTHRQSRHWL